jgi:hypothetical protein
MNTRCVHFFKIKENQNELYLLPMGNIIIAKIQDLGDLHFFWSLYSVNFTCHISESLIAAHGRDC